MVLDEYYNFSVLHFPHLSNGANLIYTNKLGDMSVYSFISGRIYPKLRTGGHTWAGAVGLGEEKKNSFRFLLYMLICC